MQSRRHSSVSLQREFDWGDHGNDYRDEARNVSHCDMLLHGRMPDRCVARCDDYWRDPAAYTVADEARLRSRYPHLGLRDNRPLRLDPLCPIYAAETGEMTTASSRRTSRSPNR